MIINCQVIGRTHILLGTLFQEAFCILSHVQCRLSENQWRPKINGGHVDKGFCSTSAGLLLLLNLTWRDAIDAIDAMAMDAMAMDAMGTVLPLRANCVDP